MVVYYDYFWRRAKFVGMEGSELDPKLPKFYLIDDGRTVTTSFDLIRSIVSIFKIQPAFCVHCRLWTLPTQDEWSDEAIGFFRQKCEEIRFKSFVLFKRMYPTESWQAIVDMKWTDQFVEKPFHPPKMVEYYMSEKMFRLALANHPILVDDLAPTIDSLEDAVELSSMSEDMEDDVNSVKKWLPYYVIPENPKTKFTKVKITYVDDCGQIYYHLYEEKSIITQMKDHYYSLYSSASSQNGSNFMNDLRKNWQVNDACVARFTVCDPCPA